MMSIQKTRANDRKRVLLVNIGFLPQVGGSYLSLFHFARSFPPGSVTVLTSHARGDIDFDLRAGIKIRRSMLLTVSDRNGEIPWLGYTPMYRNWLGRRIVQVYPLFYPVMAAQFVLMVREVRRESVDLLWSGQAAQTGWIGWGIKKMLKIPYCIFVYGEDVTYFLKRKWSPGKELFFRSLRDADLVVANSDSTRRSTLELCRERGISIRPDRFPVISPGVDTDLFRPEEEGSDVGRTIDKGWGRTLITVSRLTPQKGVDRVIRVMPEILKIYPNARYLIRGEGPHREVAERWIQKLQLGNHVRFVDPVPYEDLPSIYAQGDLFVLPCRKDESTGQLEGFGTVFLEASACGLPVIGGRSGGVTEAVVDGSTGFLVDEDDDEGLKKRILDLLGNRRLAREMGLRGRDRVVKEYGWEKRSVELWTRMREILEENDHNRRGEV